MRTELGHFIKKLIDRRGMKMCEVADAMDVSRQGLNDMLGDRWRFMPEYAIRIADAIGERPETIMAKWLEIEKKRLGYK